MSKELMAKLGDSVTTITVENLKKLIATKAKDNFIGITNNIV